MTTTPPVALILYTLRDQCADDLPRTLDLVREAGYEWVELAGTHGLTPPEFRRRLDDAGLRACSSHHGLDQFEALDPVADLADELGYRHVVMPWTEARSPEEFAPVLASLDRAAGNLAERGLRLCYHNHDFEFVPTPGGGTLWDSLVACEALSFEIDLGWAWYAGRDPAELLGSCRGRVPLLHAKDIARRGEPARFTPVGDGAVPWGEVLTTPAAREAEFVIVEQDDLYGMDPGEAIRRSRAAVLDALGEERAADA